MEFRSNSLASLYRSPAEDTVCSSTEDIPLNLTVQRPVNEFRRSKLKLHAAQLQAGSQGTLSPPNYGRWSPRILSRESSAESLFDYGVNGVCLSAPVTPTKDRRPFADDFRRAMAAKRRAEEESKLVEGSPRKVFLLPQRTDMYKRSMSVSCEVLATNERRESNNERRPKSFQQTFRTYDRTTSLVRGMDSDGGMAEDAWSSFISQTSQEDEVPKSPISRSPSPEQKPPAQDPFPQLSDRLSGCNYVKPLKLKILPKTGGYKILGQGDQTNFAPISPLVMRRGAALQPLKTFHNGEEKLSATAEEKQEERRKRNNESAKKSRKTRREKETIMLKQVMALQEENENLKRDLERALRAIEKLQSTSKNP